MIEALGAYRFIRSRGPNSKLKLLRPGFGPAAELPTSSQRDASLRSQFAFASVRMLAATAVPRDFGMRTLAAWADVTSVSMLSKRETASPEMICVLPC